MNQIVYRIKMSILMQSSYLSKFMTSTVVQWLGYANGFTVAPWHYTPWRKMAQLFLEYTRTETLVCEECAVRQKHDTLGF